MLRRQVKVQGRVVGAKDEAFLVEFPGFPGFLEAQVSVPEGLENEPIIFIGFKGPFQVGDGFLILAFLEKGDSLGKIIFPFGPTGAVGGSEK